MPRQMRHRMPPCLQTGGYLTARMSVRVPVNDPWAHQWFKPSKWAQQVGLWAQYQLRWQRPKPWQFREFGNPSRLKPLLSLPSTSRWVCSLASSNAWAMKSWERARKIWASWRRDLGFEFWPDLRFRFSFKDVRRKHMALHLLARKFLQRASPRQVIFTRELEGFMVCFVGFDLFDGRVVPARLWFLLVMGMKWELVLLTLLSGVVLCTCCLWWRLMGSREIWGGILDELWWVVDSEMPLQVGISCYGLQYLVLLVWVVKVEMFVIYTLITFKNCRNV